MISQMRSRSLRYRAPMLWLLLPFMLGLVAGRVELFHCSVRVILASSGVLFLVSAWPRLPFWIWAIGFCGAIALAGAALYGLTQRRLSAWDDLPPREMRLQVKIERVFTPHPGSKSISGAGVVVPQERSSYSELVGQHVYFSLLRRTADRELVPSEVIGVSGVLSVVPRQAAAATFDSFLINSGIYFRLSRGRNLGRVVAPTPYRDFCDTARRRLSSILDHGLEKHPSLSSVYRGMVLGEASELTEEQNRWFRESGTMHLFSISGLHIAAIAVAMHMLFGVFRLPKWINLCVSLCALWLYVDVTGGSPSAVRAFVMVALLETAFVLRRAVNPVATLAFAAFVSLLANPMQLFGASFQMSYGIVAVLLLLGLPLAEAWQERWILFRDLPKVTWTWRHHVLSWLHRTLLSAVSLGVSTSLISAICGVLYFGMLTPGAIVANLVLIPASSLALWAGFLSLLTGLAGLLKLSSVFNHAAALTLMLMQKGIQVLLTIPGMFVMAHFRSVSIGYLALGGLLGIILAGYACQWKIQIGRWSAPFCWVALVLLLGVTY